MASSGWSTLAATHGIPLALLPGDDKPDPELAALSTVPADAAHRLWRYLAEGGAANAEQFLRYAASLIGRDDAVGASRRRCCAPGSIGPAATLPSLDDIRRALARRRAGRRRSCSTGRWCRRANTAPVDALVAALVARGARSAAALRARASRMPKRRRSLGETVRGSAAGRSSSTRPALPSRRRASAAPTRSTAPIARSCRSSSPAASEDSWRGGTRGLGAARSRHECGAARDRRPHPHRARCRSRRRRAAIPRPRPISSATSRSPTASPSSPISRATGRGCARSRRPSAASRWSSPTIRTATAASATASASTRRRRRSRSLRALARGRLPRSRDVPADGDALIAPPARRPDQRAAPGAGRGDAVLRRLFGVFRDAAASRAAGGQRRAGAPPSAIRSSGRAGSIAAASPFPASAVGNVAVADPAGARLQHRSRRRPITTRRWCRRTAISPSMPGSPTSFRADAVVHVGKHGNLEWLPGKALALSAECFPEAVLGPLPHLYPFIVNDPGEGTQAKRRAQAVIIDHLTPPLTRAESYGAAGRARAAGRRILRGRAAAIRAASRCSPRADPRARRAPPGSTGDCGIAADDDDGRGAAQARRLSLRAEGAADPRWAARLRPSARRASSCTRSAGRAARARRAAPRRSDASLLRALADDLGLGERSARRRSWPSPGPGRGRRRSPVDGPWRSAGDTVERLEVLALAARRGRSARPNRAGRRPRAVLDWIEQQLAPGGRGVRRGRDRGPAAPGSTGASCRRGRPARRPAAGPTCCRPGAISIRSIPAPCRRRRPGSSAGNRRRCWSSATRRSTATTRRAIALSAWGTANMRTGGDDIAQALALMGVRPRLGAATRPRHRLRDPAGCRCSTGRAST